MEETKKNAQKVPFVPAVLVLLFLVGAVVLFTVGLGSAPHVPLILATVVAAGVGLAYKHKWMDMRAGMVDAISAALPSLLIIMSVGIVIAMWMAGGVIPAMVVYGLRIISPQFFLVTTLIICSLVSLALGSSLSTIGTVGVALFSIGAAMGLNPAMVAGAIVSGAYFGDKMSPLSDTTNLAPAVSGAGLFDHIQHMMGSTVPTYIICVLLYGGLNLAIAPANADTGQATAIADGITGIFWINPVLLLPPLVIILFVMKRMPPLPGLMLAALLGLVCALVFQGANFKDLVTAIMNGFTHQSGDATLDTFLNRGGLMSMMRTVALAILSLCFAGVFECTGMAEALVVKIMKRVRTNKGLVVATILTAWLILIATGQQYVAIILTGRLYRRSFENRDLAPENLSRALEDSGTVFGAIVPHSTGASFTESALGVTAWQYGPYTFFGWINPLVAIGLALLGRGIKPALRTPAPGQPAAAQAGGGNVAERADDAEYVEFEEFEGYEEDADDANDAPEHAITAEMVEGPAAEFVGPPSAGGRESHGDF